MHQEWDLMFNSAKLSEIVWSAEVIFVGILLDLLLHIVFESLWISVGNFLKDVEELHDLSSKGSYEAFSAVVAVNIMEVFLDDFSDFSPKDDIAFNLVSIFFKELVLCSLFSCQSSVLLSDLVLLLCLDLVLLALLDRLILLFDSSLVHCGGHHDSVSHNLGRSKDSGLIFL